MKKFSGQFEPNHLLGVIITVVGLVTSMAVLGYGYYWLQESMAGGVGFDDLKVLAVFSLVIAAGFAAIGAAVYKEPV